jgi:lipid II:glycine glycyltransferase (peptidoglycan interpeptide bridge formation enzyme)
MISTKYDLAPLPPAAAAGWEDLLLSFTGRELFHQPPWLNYLKASRKVDIRQWEIRERGATLGFFCGGIVRKGPFRILGSPLRGWGTNYMGPVTRGDIDVTALLSAVDRLALDERLAMVELESRLFGDREMAHAGFTGVSSTTYVVQLKGYDSEHLWTTLNPTTRNRVRKALACGATVEDASDDPAIADEFYSQYFDLTRRKGVVPPYGPECPRQLVTHLQPAGLLFALRVRDKSGRLLATGLFPHDDRTMYFWGGASSQDALHLCPNDLLHWRALQLAAEHKLFTYDMCGAGRFKKKFGGDLVPLKRWHKGYVPGIRWARHTYDLYHHTRRRFIAHVPRTLLLKQKPPQTSRPRYELQPLSPADLVSWDALVVRYESSHLFHRRAWLNYLAASRGVDPRFWSIREGSRLVGYFCGGVMRKGPFRLLGSPMKGWTTNFMGPLVNRDFDQRAFLRAVDALAAAERFAIVELENPLLSADAMEEFGYTGVRQPTYIVDLTPSNPSHMWTRIDPKSRQKIRKATRSGLVVEESNDPLLADEFYDQFVEVLARKSLFPPYGPAIPRLLLTHLSQARLLLSLRVRNSEGATVAVGLFPHDSRSIYFWGGASRIAAWSQAPNDLLQWTVMERAAAMGLRVYNMCGYGYFKSKFGGVLEDPRRWHKCYAPTAQLARKGYEIYFNKKLRAQSWWQRLRHVAHTTRTEDNPAHARVGLHP